MKKILLLWIIGMILLLPVVNAGIVTTAPSLVNDGQQAIINIGNGINPEINFIGSSRTESRGEMQRYGHSTLASLNNIGESATIQIPGPSNPEFFGADFWMITVYVRVYTQENGCVRGIGSLSGPTGNLCGGNVYLDNDVFNTNDPRYFGRDFTFRLDSKDSTVSRVEVWADTWYRRTLTTNIPSQNPRVNVNSQETSFIGVLQEGQGSGFQSLRGIEQNIDNVLRFNVAGSNKIIYQIRYERPDVAVPVIPPVGTNVRALNFDGATTRFSQLTDISNIQNMILEKMQSGKIEFLDSIDLRQSLNLDNGVVIQNNIVAIDTSLLPGFANTRARITLKGLSYNNEPRIFKNSGFVTSANQITQECSNCNIISRTIPPTSNGVVVFEVPGFSSYKISDVPISLFSGLRNLDFCSNGARGNLNVEVREPDDNEDIRVGDDVDVEVRVRNNGNSDKNVIVEASLFNLDEDKEEKKVSEEERVRANDESNLELNFRVPRTLDEDDSYILFVKAFEDGNEGSECNFDFVDVDVERRRHEIVFENLELIDSEVEAGDVVLIDARIKNKGNDEKDAYIRALSSEFNLDIRSDKLDLDSGEGLRKRISFTIPENSKEGSYLIEVSVNSDGFSKSEFVTLNVISKKIEKVKLEPVIKQVISNSRVVEKESFFKFFEDNLFLIVLVVANLVLLIILLVLQSL